jgi:hypothetical protein
MIIMPTESEWIAIGGFVTICASALALVIKQVESSKCTDINTPCCACKRKVDSKSTEKEEETLKP